MRTLRPPDSGGRLQRSVAACLAAILEVDVAEVPVPDEEHPEPWTVWRNWLAQRGLGLVPIAEPASFNGSSASASRSAASSASAGGCASRARTSSA